MRFGSGAENAILRNLLLRTTEAYERQLAALAAERGLAETTLASIADGVVTTDAEGRITLLNAAAAELTGWAPAAALGRPLSDVLRLVGSPAEEELVEEAAENEVCPTLVRRDGRRYSVRWSSSPLHGIDGAVTGRVVVFQDVTDSRLMALQLAHQAKHDALTGLLNRQAFERLLAEAIDGGEPGCVAYFDLDQFKVVNDTNGHVAGDELLRRVAAQILEHAPPEATVARLGGDEFGLLLRGAGVDRAVEAVEEVRGGLDRMRFVWQGAAFPVPSSVGVVPIGGEIAGGVSEVLAAADHACYMAKEKGRDRVQVYRADDRELVRRTGEMDWVVRIRRSIEEDRLCLYGQPIVPLCAGERAGRLHLEVLVRMLGDDDQPHPPSAFIGAAERYGLMPDIDRWVIEHALELVSRLPSETVRRLDLLSINLSGETVGRDGFGEWVEETLERSPLPASSICFELTETAAIAHLERAVALMQRLRGRGCRFALDDFGSGMSSYAYLKELPVSYLKIDGAFVREIPAEVVDRAMVQSINQLAHLMGLETIAEMVSNQALLEGVEQLGVDWAQGYWIGRPRPLEELFDLGLERRPRRGDG